MPPRPPPWWSRRTKRERTAIGIGAGLLLFAFVVTLAREGAFGKALELDVSHFDAKNKWNISSSHNTSWTSTVFGDQAPPPPPSLAGHPLLCNVTCDGDDEECAEAMRVFHCESTGEGAPVMLSGTIHIDAPSSCYVPLAKSATVHFQAQFSLSVSSDSGSKTGSYSAQGTVEEQMDGVASCLTFRRAIGESAGQALVQDLNGFLRAN